MALRRTKNKGEKKPGRKGRQRRSPPQSPRAQGNGIFPDLAKIDAMFPLMAIASVSSPNRMWSIGPTPRTAYELGLDFRFRTIRTLCERGGSQPKQNRAPGAPTPHPRRCASCKPRTYSFFPPSFPHFSFLCFFLDLWELSVYTCSVFILYFYLFSLLFIFVLGAPFSCYYVYDEQVFRD